ncbi:MAG: trypsin-like serine protease [Chitinophagaceae bacterium]|nr:trypsin-like serine protease [Oligoflexus sp.]
MYSQAKHFRIAGRLSILILSALILARCGRQTPSSLDVIGGNVPNQESPAAYSTVALVGSLDHIPFCSGTYIAANLIVTAAHCVINKEKGEFKVMFGNAETALFTVTAFQTYKPIQKFESNFDIAWVKFEGRPPEVYRPIEILRAPVTLTPGTPIQIAGYGYTAYPCGDATVACNNTLLQSLDTFVKEYVSTPRLYSLITVDSKADGSPCFGDSGGPAFVKVQGHWYLAGEFMGWDRILVPENPDTICSSGQGIYTFVGNYVEWLETSSKTMIIQNAFLNPKDVAVVKKAPVTVPRTFQDWCEQQDNAAPSWYTVQKIIRLASDYRIKTDNPLLAREIFTDCAVAETWVRKMIQSKGTLVLSTFDQYNSNYAAKVEDLAPLLSLVDSGITSMIIEDSAITDFRPLNAFPALTKLEIKNNEGQIRYPIDFSNFKAITDLHLENSAPSFISDSLSSLKLLETLALSRLFISHTSSIDFSRLKTMKLTNVTADVPLDLSLATQIRSLNVTSTEIKALAENMGSLEELTLIFDKNSPKLPTIMPKLKLLNLIGLDLTGSISLREWKSLEKVHLSYNKQLDTIDGIEDLPSIEELMILHNGIKTLGKVKNTPRLVTIDLGQNSFADLPTFEDVPSLRDLNLGSNQLQHLPGLPLTLRKLDLSTNPLRSLDGLKFLKNLQILTLAHVEGNGLSIPESLGELPLLEELTLTGDKVRNVSDLLQYPKLKKLFLDDNLIEDLSPLSRLTELVYIQAIGNPLKDDTCPLIASACRLTLFPHMTISSALLASLAKFRYARN